MLGDGASVRVGLGLKRGDIDDQFRRGERNRATCAVRGSLLRSAHARLSAPQVGRGRPGPGERIAAQRYQHEPKRPTHALKLAPFPDLGQTRSLERAGVAHHGRGRGPPAERDQNDGRLHYRDLSQQDEKDRRCWMARRVVRRATQHQLTGGSARPPLSPSVLVLFL